MSEWTPPEVWVVFKPPSSGPIDVMSNDCLDEDGEVRDDCVTPGEEVVPYVPESVVDALREENARLKAKGLDDFTVTGDEYDRLLAERDALRARVEELEAGLRDAIEEVGCAPVAHMPHLAHQAQVSAASVDRWRALLSGGSQRPDTDETCPDCDGSGRQRLGEKKIVCTRCDGSGRVERCPHCDRHGQAWFGASPSTMTLRDCSKCGGTKIRPDTKETKR